MPRKSTATAEQNLETDEASIPSTPPNTDAAALQSNSISTDKSKKVSSACDSCRKKHARCDGQRPCYHCLRTNIKCLYTVEDKRRRKVRNEETGALQSQIDNLENALNVLKFGSDGEAAYALKVLRRTAAESSSSAAAKGSTLFQADGIEPDAYGPQIVSNVVDDDLSIFSTSRLPPETIVICGSNHFFDVTSSIFWCVDRREFEEIVQTVYHSGNSPSIVDLAQICALTAAGCRYQLEAVDESMVDALYGTAVRWVPILIDNDLSQAVKCLIALALFGLTERPKSTRSFLALGLQLARWSLYEQQKASITQVVSQKIYRSLILLECFVNSAWGFDTSLMENELNFVQDQSSRINSPTHSSEEAGQAIITSVAILKAQIHSYVSSVDEAQVAVVEDFVTRLRHWQQNLPSFMELSYLSNSVRFGNSNTQQTTLLFAHALYFGATMGLLRNILVRMAEGYASGSWPMSDPFHSQAARHHDIAISAARSSARIFVFLRFESMGNDRTTQYWLRSFEILTASTIVLFDIAVKLALGIGDSSEIHEDLDRTESCLHLLKVFETTETMERLYGILFPVFAALRNAFGGQISLQPRVESQRAQELMTQGELDLRSSSQNPTSRIIMQLAKVLKDPHGRSATSILQASPEQPSMPLGGWWAYGSDNFPNLLT